MKKIILLASLLAAVASTTTVQAHPATGTTNSQTESQEINWDEMGE